MSQSLPEGSRVAFFGGSFDPPHLGHIAVARAAQQALELDRVLFAPVGLQPLKPAGSSASFADRVAMTRLAIEPYPDFALSLADAPSEDSANPANHATPNYTFDTLTRLRQSLPPETRLSLLLGADSLRTLRHWHRAEELPFLASLIVASRPAEDLGDLQACFPPAIQLESLPSQPYRYRLTNRAGDRSQLTLLPDLQYDISATALRAAIHGQPCAEPHQIAPAVLAYIRTHHLYR